MEFLVPLSIMVFLNLFLTFRLLYMATMYTLNKDVKLSQFRINEGKFPDRLRSARQQYQNMFEIPILFYLLCLLNIFFNQYTQFDIILAWCFVLFRVLHFFIRVQKFVFRHQSSSNQPFFFVPMLFVFLRIFLFDYLC